MTGKNFGGSGNPGLMSNIVEFSLIVSIVEFSFTIFSVLFENPSILDRSIWKQKITKIILKKFSIIFFLKIIEFDEYEISKNHTVIKQLFLTVFCFHFLWIFALGLHPVSWTSSARDFYILFLVDSLSFLVNGIFFAAIVLCMKRTLANLWGDVHQESVVRFNFDFQRKISMANTKRIWLTGRFFSHAPLKSFRMTKKDCQLV